MDGYSLWLPELHCSNVTRYGREELEILGFKVPALYMKCYSGI